MRIQDFTNHRSGGIAIVKTSKTFNHFSRSEKYEGTITRNSLSHKPGWRTVIQFKETLLWCPSFMVWLESMPRSNISSTRTRLWLSSVRQEAAILLCYSEDKHQTWCCRRSSKTKLA
jgi:hypothetical protein